jgi:hypothetical protein
MSAHAPPQQSKHGLRWDGQCDGDWDRWHVRLLMTCRHLGREGGQWGGGIRGFIRLRFRSPPPPQSGLPGFGRGSGRGARAPHPARRPVRAAREDGGRSGNRGGYRFLYSPPIESIEYWPLSFLSPCRPMLFIVHRSSAGVRCPLVCPTLSFSSLVSS